MSGQVSKHTAPTVVTTEPATPLVTQVETVARDAGARICAWSRGEDIVRTPMILLAEETGDLTAVPAFDPARTGPQASIRLDGGFHAHADGTHESFGGDAENVLFAGILDGATDRPQVDRWAHIVIDRPRRIEGLLALCNARGASGDAQLGEDEEGADAIDRTPDEATRDWPGPVTDDNETFAVWPEAASAYTDPAQFVPRLLDALGKTGGHRVLYAPGIGLPHELALLSYAGIDVFDTLAVDRMAHLGYLTTPDGVIEAATIGDPFPVPATFTAGPSYVVPAELDLNALRELNRAYLIQERDTIAPRIRNHTLRHLVEARVRAHPETVALLRHVDRTMGTWLADRIPLSDTGRCLATTMDSLHRPDIERFRRRMRDNYRPPANADILLLLPCSARKPYSKSRSHKSFRRAFSDLYAASRIHEVIITSPLGVVPRELENTWPAAHYDVPVTGNWDAEEGAMIRAQLQDLLGKASYKHVISHLGPSTHALVADLLPDGAVHTAAPRAMDFACRMAMRDALFAAASDGATAPAWPQRRLAEAKAVATWQYGPDAADALFAKADGTGARPPATRVLVGGRKGQQLCQVVPQKGLIVMTMLGAKELFVAGLIKQVEIADFRPKGTIFAVGVMNADSTIVVGDDVAIVHDGELRSVGVALMPGSDMGPAGRGGCVEVKHHA